MSAIQSGALDAKFGQVDEHWRPKVVAALNGQEVKLVKTKGVFPWHRHHDAEEMFMVWRGRFRVEFRDRIVDMGPGEFCVVPRDVEHRTASDEEADDEQHDQQLDERQSAAQHGLAFRLRKGPALPLGLAELRPGL